MNRLTVLVDIAGRVMHATAGSPLTVAGAVAVDTAALDALRCELRDIPKWGSATDDHITHVVDILRSQSIAVAVLSVNRDTDIWRQFVIDSKVLHSAIVKKSKSVARWANASNLLKFTLLGSAAAIATGHALGSDRRSKIVNALGHQIIECQTICDNEVEGKENLKVFQSFWAKQHISAARLERFQIELLSTSISVTTDTDDPDLLLADYAAGLGLAYTLENQGNMQLPITRQRAFEHLEVLRRLGKLVIRCEDFDQTYDGVFGHVMQEARELADTLHLAEDSKTK